MWIIIATTVYFCIMSAILKLCKAASMADKQQEKMYSKAIKEAAENRWSLWIWTGVKVTTKNMLWHSTFRVSEESGALFNEDRLVFNGKKCGYKYPKIIWD